MLAVSSQKNLNLRIKTVLRDDELLIFALKGREGLSSPFEFELDLYSPSCKLDLEKLLGTPVTVSLQGEDDQGKFVNMRYFSGLIAKIEQSRTIQPAIELNSHEEITVYRAFIYPKLWMLKLSKNYRIFQNKNTIQIVSQILSENGVTEFDNLVTKSGQRVREYCVQYGESCFDFISRLLEEEGIFYFFNHLAGGYRLVLADHNGVTKFIGLKKIAFINQTEPQHLNIIHQFNVQKSIIAKQVQMVDYNYLTPLNPLHPKLSTTKVSAAKSGGIIQEYPGGFSKLNEGETLVDLRTQVLEWQSQLYFGKSTTPALQAGKKFQLNNHPNSRLNREYIVYEITHDIRQIKPEMFDVNDNNNQQPGIICRNEFSALEANVNFRPHLKTTKPKIWSNQTAIVTGPRGEEVFCDKYGRIKLKFPWDLSGKDNETSSCWVRVAQSWAGTNWGGLVIPRVGMEVVVTYINGDPDHPLVIGCVYNGHHTPPDYVVESPTKSTFKSSTSKGAKGSEGFNEIRFEDKKGQEEIYFHAQKDWNQVIGDSRKDHILKGSDTLTLDQGSKFVVQNGKNTLNQLNIKQGDKIIIIEQGNHNVTLKKGDYSITIKRGNVDIKVDGKININSSGDMEFSSNKNIKFKAKGNIEMEAGMSINQQAKMNLESNAGLSAKLNGKLKVEITGGAIATLKAALVKVN